jgi:hypothetical protein
MTGLNKLPPTARTLDAHRPLKGTFGNIVRGAVERTFGWMTPWQRLVRDYEQRIDVSHAMILVAMGGNLVRRNAHP